MPCTSRFQLLLTGGSGIISLLCLILVIVVFVAHTCHKSELEAIKPKGIMCIEREKILTYLQDSRLYSQIEKLPERVEAGVRKCCADNTKHMSIIMEAMAEKSREKTEPPVASERINVTQNGISAHRRLVQPAGYAPTKDGLPHFLEDSNVPLSLDPDNHDPVLEHAQNIEVLTSGFRVLFSGLYHVYSSIHFSTRSSKRCAAFKHKTWRQSVVLIRPNDPMASGTLLTAAHSCCDNCTREKETSFTGGAFSLSAGDYLRVEVSGTGLVAFEKESSFFGLTILGDISRENDEARG